MNTGRTRGIFKNSNGDFLILPILVNVDAIGGVHAARYFEINEDQNLPMNIVENFIGKYEIKNSHFKAAFYCQVS